MLPVKWHVNNYWIPLYVYMKDLMVA